MGACEGLVNGYAGQWRCAEECGVLSTFPAARIVTACRLSVIEAMANREDLLIIRAARAGEAAAQLKLGRRYLFGGAGLPKNLPTALYWLDRAAQQDEPDAWMLIGQHVPFETVQRATQPEKLVVWYERAFDAGVAQAGLVLAKLVLGQPRGAVDDAMRSKALRALQAAAHAGVAEAQWLLAQLLGHADGDSVTTWPTPAAADGADNEAMLEWATRAARSGVADAQYAMADHAWARGDMPGYLHWSQPLVRARVESAATLGASERDISLVLRTAHALSASAGFDVSEVTRLLEWAAQMGDGAAQYSLGLWLARMDADGNRLLAVPGTANYKRAIRWLSLAADHGLHSAWYALSKIYQKPECAQRNLADARRCLEKAANAGHGMAQLELGKAAWRARRENASNDVLAAGWLLKAQAQGNAEASDMLERIATRATPAPWAQAILGGLSRADIEGNSLLVARLELAARFGLSRTEALLIDPRASDYGHCMVVDVRSEHPHSKRRLILVQTAEERRTLDRVGALFERDESGSEGNFRQRLYRLKTLV